MFRDLRYAVRSLRQNPGFASVCIVSLALGIGATSAIFALADGLILRPLSVPDPSRVVTVEAEARGQGINGLFSFSGLSYPDYRDVRDRSKSFSGVSAAQFSTFGFAAERDALPKMEFGELVSGNFFRVMDVSPMLGRSFRPDEDQVPGRDAVVVLSYDLWKNEFASAPDVTGRKVYLNTVPFTVIGVAPASFTGSDVLLRSALFVPLAMSPSLAADPKNSNLERRAVRAYTVRGRLNPGVALSQAAAEVRILGDQLSRAYPDTNRTISFTAESDLRARFRQNTIDATLMAFLMALAAVVMLIACANVMNLMLSRARGRAREIAVRLAIGAGRYRLVRQLLTESLVIAVTGGALGLIVAQLGVDLFSQIQIPTDIPIIIDLHLDLRVLAFAMAVSLASAILFGLAPALQTTHPDLVPALKSGRAEGGKRRRFLGRNALVIAQIAGSLLLLIFATQAYRGASILLSSPLGFRTDHLLLANFDPSLARYSPTQIDDFYKRLLDGARNLSGVEDAALAQSIPLMPANIGARQVVPEGFRLPQGTDSVSVLTTVVSDDYFRTVGMSLVEGREFRVTDRAGSTRVAVVNEQFARKYFPNHSAIGKRFVIKDQPESHTVQIVGVAKQSKYIFPAEPPFEYLYMPLSQNPAAAMTLMLHTAGPSGDAAESVRKLVRSIDSGQPIIGLRTMENFFDMRARRTMQVLIEAIGGLGVLGLMLALVGLYGLMTYSVGLRQREIGIRMAVGADRTGVLKMVLRQGMVLAGTGGLIGLALTLFVGGPVTAYVGAKSFYFPLVGFVFVALLAAAAMGAYVPARRASRLDPNTILRQE